MRNALCLLLTLLTCFRAEASFKGSYVGISGGVAHESVKFGTSYSGIPTSLIIVAPIFGTVTGTHDAKVGKWNGWGEVLGGWGTEVCHKVYLGGCLGANVSTYEVRHRFNSIQDLGSATSFIRSTWVDDVKFSMGALELTADFKPGYLVTCRTLAFALIGVACNEEKMRGKITQVVADLSGQGPSATSTLTVAKRRLCAGLRLGVGLEEKLTQCLALNLKYVFTCYQPLSASGAAASLARDLAVPVIDTFPNGLKNRVNAKPRKHVASIGIGYYF